MNPPGGIVEQSSGPAITAPNRSGLLIQFRLGLVMLAPILVVATLVVFLPPDGNERSDWLQFIGRFHPLLVHFPIAMFLLVPILEIVGRNARFAYLRLSVNFVLALETLAAPLAAFSAVLVEAARQVRVIRSCQHRLSSSRNSHTYPMPSEAAER